MTTRPGMAVQIFDNHDFGYYKVTIDRPDRRRAQFSAERLAPLRFDKHLSEAMEYILKPTAMPSMATSCKLSAKAF